MNEELESMRKHFLQFYRSFETTRKWMDSQPEPVQISFMKACGTSCGPCFCGSHKFFSGMEMIALWNSCGPPDDDELKDPVAVSK